MNRSAGDPVPCGGAMGSPDEARDEEASAHQAWVLEQFQPKMAWDPEFWSQRLGTPDEGFVKDVVRHAFRAYYYPSGDLTLVVNIARGWVLFYRQGRAERGIWE